MVCHGEQLLCQNTVQLLSSKPAYVTCSPLVHASPSSGLSHVATFVPLNSMCSRKCAVPLFSSVSNLLPELIHMPTVAVSAYGTVSVATRNPFGNVETWVPAKYC